MAHTYLPILSVAGSDSSGGAGIQADIKTISALGCYAMTAITALTAQNTLGVTAIQVADPEMVEAQIDMVFSDIRPLAVKIGMLGNGDVAASVARALARNEARNVVLDPVLYATSGANLAGDDAFAPMKEGIFPISCVITPNLDEARTLAGLAAGDATAEKDELVEIVGRLQADGARAVLITGVESADEPDKIVNWLFPAGSREGVAIPSTKIDTPNTHGTGCTLSSAIASYLGRGSALATACIEATGYVHSAIQAGARAQIGRGHGPVNHFFDPRKLIML